MSYRLGVDVGGTFTDLVLVAPDGVDLPAKCTLTVRRGDVFRHELAGAGGWATRSSAIPRACGAT